MLGWALALSSMTVTMAASAARAAPPSSPPTGQVAVFRAAGFPTVDAPEIAGAVLDQATAGRSRLVVFERGTGKVLAATPGADVTVAKRPSRT